MSGVQSGVGVGEVGVKFCENSKKKKFVRGGLGRGGGGGGSGGPIRGEVGVARFGVGG